MARHQILRVLHVHEDEHLMSHPYPPSDKLRPSLISHPKNGNYTALAVRLNCSHYKMSINCDLANVPVCQLGVIVREAFHQRKLERGKISDTKEGKKKEKNRVEMKMTLHDLSWVQ